MCTEVMAITNCTPTHTHTHILMPYMYTHIHAYVLTHLAEIHLCSVTLNSIDFLGHLLASTLFSSLLLSLPNSYLLLPATNQWQKFCFRKFSVHFVCIFLRLLHANIYLFSFQTNRKNLKSPLLSYDAASKAISP